MVTVKEMIECLQRYDENMPVLIRKNEGDGCYSDWKCSLPALFTGADGPCLMAYEPHKLKAQAIIPEIDPKYFF